MEDVNGMPVYEIRASLRSGGLRYGEPILDYVNRLGRSRAEATGRVAAVTAALNGYAIEGEAVAGAVKRLRRDLSDLLRGQEALSAEIERQRRRAEIAEGLVKTAHAAASAAGIDVEAAFDEKLRASRDRWDAALKQARGERDKAELESERLRARAVQAEDAAEKMEAGLREARAEWARQMQKVQDERDKEAREAERLAKELDEALTDLRQAEGVSAEWMDRADRTFVADLLAAIGDASEACGRGEDETAVEFVLRMARELGEERAVVRRAAADVCARNKTLAAICEAADVFGRRAEESVADFIKRLARELDEERAVVRTVQSLLDHANAVIGRHFDAANAAGRRADEPVADFIGRQARNCGPYKLVSDPGSLPEPVNGKACSSRPLSVYCVVDGPDGEGKPVKVWSVRGKFRARFHYGY